MSHTTQIGNLIFISDEDEYDPKTLPGEKVTNGKEADYDISN